MTDPMAIASALVIIVGSISTAAVAIISAIGRVKKELLAGQSKTEKKTEEIHALVNGSASLAAEKLSALERQVAELHAEITRLQERRIEEAKATPAGSAPRDRKE